jgi:hypothetical protein
VKLTDRDHLVLETLERFRLARTSDLILTCFPGINPTTAKLRIRRLFDAGYIQIHSAQIGFENVYRCKAKIPRGSLLHHLAVVRIWAQLTSRPLDLCRADWELREEIKHPEIVPDIFAVIQGKGFAIEVDRGTESKTIINRKLAVYRTIPELFGHRYRVVFVSEGTDPWPLLLPLLREQEF